MREIEVKARIVSAESFIQQLEGLGIKLSQPLIQKDRIFAENVEEFAQFKPDTNYLRIREQNGKYIFTAKRSLINDLSAIEHETVIDKPAELAAIIELLGYREAVRVNKVRRKAEYRGLEICVDEVEGLGAFVEVEKLTEETDADRVQNELFEFLKTFNIKAEDREKSGYDTLMFLKNQQLTSSSS